MKKLEYPLVAVTLTQQQCDKIMSLLLATSLSKAGYNRNFPRKALHGPPSLMGGGLHHIYIAAVHNLGCFFTQTTQSKPGSSGGLPIYLMMSNQNGPRYTWESNMAMRMIWSVNGDIQKGQVQRFAYATGDGTYSHGADPRGYEVRSMPLEMKFIIRKQTQPYRNIVRLSLDFNNKGLNTVVMQHLAPC
jgi:hypothetical protein